MASISRRFTAIAALALSLAATAFPAFATDADPTLDIYFWGAGSGKVTGPSIDCLNGGANGCDPSYPAGTTVTLTATAAPGSVFSGWNGACYGASGDQCTLTMDATKGVFATFDLVGAAPDPLGYNNGTGVSINSLGEAVWSQWDNDTQRQQIFSSLRGRITSDLCGHDSPAINNLGDVVWIGNGCPGAQDVYSVQGIIGGNPGVVTSAATQYSKVDINDRREVVWDQSDGVAMHIYSSKRGILTSPDRFSTHPGINNRGDVVFLESDPQLQNPMQVYKLAAGSGTPAAVTADGLTHIDASIADTGEVVWSDMDRDTSTFRIVSSQRDTLVTRVTGIGIFNVDVNSCGDLVYVTDMQAYRLGKNAPCSSVTGTHDSMEQAAPMALGDIFTAVADGQSSPVTWYRFDATANDDIYVTINYGGLPNVLRAEIYAPQGYLVGGSYDTAPSRTMLVPAMMTTTGSYLLKLEAQGGQFGYSVSVSKYSNNCGAGPCPEELQTTAVKDGVSINTLGEIVWSAYDSYFSGRYQIFSSTRGSLTGDAYDHVSPAINDLGDTVWLVSDAALSETRVEGNIDNRRVIIASGAAEKGKPGINNRREVVWSERDGSGIWQLHSSLRGQITSGADDSTNVSIDNSGNIAYIDDDRRGHLAIMKIAAGSTTPVAAKEGLYQASSLSIGDSGEIAWVQPPTSGSDLGIWQIDSTTRGTLLNSPLELRNAAVNGCGDLAYITKNASGAGSVYLVRSSSPCASLAPHPTMTEAAPVAVGGDAFTGLVDSAAAPASWYRFDAGAGDTIRATVQYELAEGKTVHFLLYDANGNPVDASSGMDLPPKIYYRIPAAGTYFLKVEGVMGRSRYAIALDRYVPVPFKGFPVQTLDVDAAASINALGEVLWVSMDYVTGYPQIYSSLRGQLTFDANYHTNPVMNDLGDMAWVETDSSAIPKVKAVIAGKTVTIAENLYWPGPRIGITNQGEVVWSQDTNGVTQIFSSTRGQLTTGATGSWDVDVNNHGDIVFTRADQPSNRNAVYKLAAGSATPERVNTGDLYWQGDASINDSGEIVWRQDGKPYSNLRGPLNLDAASVYRLDINNCGDIVYQADMLYREGYSSPCVANPGANGTMNQAAAVSYGEVTVGVADTDAPVSWYRLEGSAGDTMHVRVNYDNTVPNVVALSIYDAAGNLVAGPTGAIDRELDYAVPADGVYFLKVEGQGGRFAYAVSTQRTAAPMLKLVVDGEPDGYFATLADLFGQAQSTADLKLVCRSGDLAGDVAINQCGKTVTIDGGYDPGFATRSGKTRLTGKLRLTCGKVVVNGLTLK